MKTQNKALLRTSHKVRRPENANVGRKTIMISVLINIGKQIGYFLIVTCACLAFMLCSTYIHVRIHPLWSPIPIYILWATLFSSFCFIYRNTLQSKARFIRYPVIAVIAAMLTVATFSICYTARIDFHFAIGGR